MISYNKKEKNFFKISYKVCWYWSKWNTWLHC